MTSIWKFELSITDEQIVSVPKGAWILTAQMQRGRLCVWAMVDTNVICEPTHFRIFGTGNPVTGLYGQYIGTVQDGGLVWHVFAEQCAKIESK